MTSLKEIFLYEAMHGDKEGPKPDYPSWICSECALKNGGRIPRDHMPTFHMGECGWCNEVKSVSEPRDYRYPNYLGLKKCIKK